MREDPGGGSHVDGGRVGAAAEKRVLRRELLARRRALPPEVVTAGSRAVVATLRTLPELVTARNVLLYAADPDEVDLDALVRTPPDGWRVLLPRVEDGRIVAVLQPPDAPLVSGALGIREPVGPATDPATIDAVVVPGAAFTPEGGRLGRGAGLYDRFLTTTVDAVHVGVCLEAFVRDEVPVEDHDVPVDVVVTDASVRRRASTRRARPT